MLEGVSTQATLASPGARWMAAHRGNARALAAARPLAVIPAFKIFERAASIEPQLVSKRMQVAPDVKLNLVLIDQPAYSKHALEGSLSLGVSAGVTLAAGFKATGRCVATGPGATVGSGRVRAELLAP